MKALIAPNENNRICQIEADEFPVAEPLFWITCPENCTPQWTYANKKFNPPVKQVLVPEKVSMRQIRLALFQQGLLSQVQTAIDAMDDPQKTATQISWDYATTVMRHDDLVIQLSISLGLTDSEVDDLFTLASTL